MNYGVHRKTHFSCGYDGPIHDTNIQGVSFSNLDQKPGLNFGEFQYLQFLYKSYHLKLCQINWSRNNNLETFKYYENFHPVVQIVNPWV